MRLVSILVSKSRQGTARGRTLSISNIDKFRTNIDKSQWYWKIHVFSYRSMYLLIKRKCRSFSGMDSHSLGKDKNYLRKIYNILRFVDVSNICRYSNICVLIFHICLSIFLIFFCQYFSYLSVNISHICLSIFPIFVIISKICRYFQYLSIF